MEKNLHCFSRRDAGERSEARYRINPLVVIFDSVYRQQGTQENYVCLFKIIGTTVSNKLLYAEEGGGGV